VGRAGAAGRGRLTQDVYAYFNNDPGAIAPRLSAVLGGRFRSSRGSLADPPVLVTGGVQFPRSEACSRVSMEVVRVRQGEQDLVEGFALRCPLVPRLSVLDDEDHRERQRGDQSLKDGLPPSRKTQAATLYYKPCRDRAEGPAGQPLGGDACRSTRDSHRLNR